MQNILIKFYGHVFPIHSLSAEIWQELVNCFPHNEHLTLDEMLICEGDMLRMSFEGVYFPIEDLLPIIEKLLNDESQGKLDYLDLEEWCLIRYAIKGKSMSYAKTGLNNVMDYSNH